MNAVDHGASPFVGWEGSHEIVRQGFLDYLTAYDPSELGSVDLTTVYHVIRRRCFEECARVEICLQPREVFWVHRLAVHGMKAWKGSSASSRMIFYFRPESNSIESWI